jgi:hypothetical protein
MNVIVFFFVSTCILLLNTNKTHLISSTSTNYPKQINEINLPDGYERLTLHAESFGSFLRKQPLKKETTVYLYNGQPKYNQTAQYAVLNISVGKRDLQQCADAVMRLRAEYLKQQQRSVCFADNAGKKYCWEEYKKRGWQSYLETVFGMCGTLSLEKELKTKSWNQVTVGDVLIKGGSPGHAVIIIDAARHRQTGEVIFLLAQSYMPAQDIHVLQNNNEKELSPWYRVPKTTKIPTPEWTFYANQLRSWR